MLSVAPAEYGVEEVAADRPDNTHSIASRQSQLRQAASAAPVQPQADDGPLMLAAVPAEPGQEPADPANRLRTARRMRCRCRCQQDRPRRTTKRDPTEYRRHPPPSAASGDNASDAAGPNRSLRRQTAQINHRLCRRGSASSVRKLDAEVLKRQSEAIRLREKDPERALATLREAQQLVNESKLPDSHKRELLSRIDKTLHDTQEYVKAHGAQIELDKRNEAVLDSVDHDREMKVKLQQKIAERSTSSIASITSSGMPRPKSSPAASTKSRRNDPVVEQIWHECQDSSAARG